LAQGYGYGLLNGSNGDNPYVNIPNNPNPQSPGAYAYGLQDTFNVQPNTGGVGINGAFYNASTSDPDVQAATNIQNEEVDARLGLNHGVNFDADDAALQMYEGRIGQKNVLGQEINANGTQRMGAIQEDQATANNALGQGINNTDSNYNSRGLLFSGARQAGEQQVRGNVASGLASSVAGTQQDYATTLAAQQNAYASVDLASAGAALTMANNAVNTASSNNIARLQAMQQLGSGVGSAAGQVAGTNAASGNPATYINPAAGWDPGGSSGINTPYNGGNQFGGYLSDPSYSNALGDYNFGSQSNG
jgi:hypothetical protein